MSRTITDSERQQAIGLRVLAQRANAQLQQLERALAEVLHEPPDDLEAGAEGGFGLVSDVVYDMTQSDPVSEIDTLLRRLGASVETSDAG